MISVFRIYHSFLYDHLMIDLVNMPRALEKNMNSDVIGCGGVLCMSHQVYCVLILLIFCFCLLIVLATEMSIKIPTIILHFCFYFCHFFLYIFWSYVIEYIYVLRIVISSCQIDTFIIVLVHLGCYNKIHD